MNISPIAKLEANLERERRVLVEARRQNVPRAEMDVYLNRVIVASEELENAKNPRPERQHIEVTVGGEKLD